MKILIYLTAIISILTPFSIAEESKGKLPGVQEYFECYLGYVQKGKLKIMKFQKNDDHTYSALRVTFRCWSTVYKPEPRSKWPGDAFKLEAGSAVIDHATYQKAKSLCLRGINTAQYSSEEFGSISSEELISGLRVVDGVSSVYGDSDSTLEKIWCGNVSSAEESFYKPLLENCEALTKLSENFKWEDSDTPLAIEFSTDLLMRYYPKLRKNYRGSCTWGWVIRYLIPMVGAKDNLRAIPLLIKLINIAQTTYSDNKQMKTTTLEYIVTAMDDITGQSLRFDSDNKPRPIDDVLADYLKVFSKRDTP